MATVSFEEGKNWWWLQMHNSVNIMNINELYTLHEWIVWYLHSISKKLWNKTKKKKVELAFQKSNYLGKCTWAKKERKLAMTMENLHIKHYQPTSFTVKQFTGSAYRCIVQYLAVLLMMDTECLNSMLQFLCA